MKSMRQHLTRVFSEKVYPNPADPKVAKKLADGVAEFRTQYLGKTFPWVLNGENVSYNRIYYRTYDPNDPLILVGSFQKFPLDLLKDIVFFHVPAIRAAGRRFT